MASLRIILNVARTKLFNVNGTGVIRIKQTTRNLILSRSIITSTVFKFPNVALVKSINSSLSRNVSTENVDKTINDNNTKLGFRRRPNTPEIAEIVIYNRIKWMRDNLYDHGCGMLRYSSVFEGMRWQDIIQLSRYELTIMGVKDIESAWRLGSCFWIIRCDLALKEGKKLPYRGGKDRVDVDLKSLDAFKDKNWREIIDMDYKDLKTLGIESVNDRIKLIKNFWAIRRKLYHIERIEKCAMILDNKTG
ncbi:29_t:CDS:2 [Scutellospora calospora]|uniref:29_t:CDS:1 n=1 Tax=Scutellospora calospora TaxID=85575 RepID=A0ACA9JUM2_9GLOM|nr:29_t:CDS:2 [Scutellospora calospora]